MLLLAAGSVGHAASFDCAKATTTIEKQICADDQLSALDSRLAQSYMEAKSNSSSADLFKSEQRAWLATVRNKCADAECLKQAYTARIANLGGTVRNPPVPSTTIAATTDKSDQNATIAERSGPLASSSSSSVQSTVKSSPPQEAGANILADSAKAGIVTSGGPTTARAEAEPVAAIAAEPSLPTDGRTGVVGELAKAFALFLLLATVVLLIKPDLLARWMTAPSRKAIAGGGIAALVLATALVNATKGADERAEDVARQNEIDAKRDRVQLAQQQAQAAKSPAKVSASNAPDDKCINAALDVGYVDGMCAYSFIDACVTTGSRDEMNQQLAITKMVGRVNERGCSSMPTTYVNQFNAAYSRRYRF